MKRDKLLHFGACLVFSLAGPYGVAFAAGAAASKEYDDSKEHGNSWSWGDILADAAGIAVGYGLHLFAKLILC